MANLVLALGVVMSLIGIAAVATGYPIIQIERGWASVIAGSTLLAGGVVTVSLGLAIRALAGLEKSLRQKTFVAPALPNEPYVSDYALPEPAPSLVATEPDVAPAEQDLAPAERDLAAAERDLAAAERDLAAAERDLAPAAPAVAWASEPPRFEPEIEPEAQSEPAKAPRTVEEQTEALLMRNVADAAVEAKSERTKSERAKFEAPEAEASEIGSPPPPPPPRMPRVAAPFGAPPRTREPFVPKEPEATIDPAKIDDWFDREFSDLDRHAPEPLAASPADLEPPMPAQEPEIAEAPPTAAEVVPPPPPAPTSAVIGRYESEGTSYVMYADGSIEAQSPAGVYRFGSMAELKAFIEG